MAEQPAPVLEGAELERAVESRIEDFTGGRVERLRVQMIDGRMVIHGVAASYYVRHLALQAALAVAPGADGAVAVRWRPDGPAGPPGHPLPGVGLGGGGGGGVRRRVGGFRPLIVVARGRNAGRAA